MGGICGCVCVVALAKRCGVVRGGGCGGGVCGVCVCAEEGGCVVGRSVVVMVWGGGAVIVRVVGGGWAWCGCN